ncbi:MAG: hypothetical protein PHD10_02220 [Bacilli bacterium]|nr:hypothetical protein [Bacilli bacterium]MDD4283197.1 hypothetical protein [Bacilli bacterium]MDD4607928.1 hypothetical protein [Bacilli bacterium]
MESLSKFVTDAKDIDVYFDMFADQNPPKEAIDYFRFHYEKNFSSGSNVLDDIRTQLGKMGYETLVKRADMDFSEYMEDSLYGK